MFSIFVIYFCRTVHIIVLYAKLFILIQWAPLNWITLGPRQTDPINRQILWYEFQTGLEYRYKNDPIKRMNLLTVIPLAE
jgi:hypothetical protein